jgi:hypothetical protein
MILQGPETYKILFDSEKYEIKNNLGLNKFSGCATRINYKLYIVSIDNRPAYVGVTTQPMAGRLRLGWNANGESGYHGYKWRHHLPGEAHLDVWELPEGVVEDNKLFIETIEAEIVFLIRQAGQWPRFQTEIHFHESKEEHRNEANEILKKYQRE